MEGITYAILDRRLLYMNHIMENVMHFSVHWTTTADMKLKGYIDSRAQMTVKQFSSGFMNRYVEQLIRLPQIH